MNLLHKFFGGGGHLNDEGVALYVDALRLKTIPQLPSAVRDHVAKCQECKKSITGLFMLLDDTHYGDVQSHPFFETQRATESRFSLFMKIAAVVVGIVSLATVAYLIGPFRPIEGPNETSQNAMGGSTDTSQKSRTNASPAANENLAADFTANPNLDELVNARSRSREFVVQSPGNGVLVGPNCIFRWKHACRLTSHNVHPRQQGEYGIDRDRCRLRIYAQTKTDAGALLLEVRKRFRTALRWEIPREIE